MFFSAQFDEDIVNTVSIPINILLLNPQFLFGWDIPLYDTYFSVIVLHNTHSNDTYVILHSDEI